MVSCKKYQSKDCINLTKKTVSTHTLVLVIVVFLPSIFMINLLSMSISLKKKFNLSVKTNNYNINRKQKDNNDHYLARRVRFSFYYVYIHVTWLLLKINWTDIKNISVKVILFMNIRFLLRIIFQQICLESWVHSFCEKIYCLCHQTLEK